MKTMRSGFTMIELIFVIVILGILAAVALPKFIGVGNQAHNVKVVDFTSTLNRSVMPQVWGQAMSDGYNGDITKEVVTKTDLEKYTQIPSELTDVNMSRAGTNFAVIWGSLPEKVYVKSDYDGSSTFEARSYAIVCTKGDAANVPYCNAYLSTLDSEKLASSYSVFDYHYKKMTE